MQVLVSRLKDNWKFAQLRGTSTMHILDRFSISVQMERRIMFIQDPQWPGVILSGNLPKLIVHVSEQKVNALQTCIDIINSPVVNNHQPVVLNESSHDGSGALFDISNGSKCPGYMDVDGPKYDSDDQKCIGEETRLILMQFCVDQMSFNVQSRGRSVAELQVTGVKTTFSKRPYDTSVTLCVHSLLLVDALQTYGSDFELLVASHKHVSMDSASGSLCDSDPSSPMSPGSPDPIQSPLGISSPAPLSALSAALSSLQSSSLKVNPRRWKSSTHAPISELSDSDALIIIEFNIVESPSSSKENSELLQIATVQFNNLDVITNQGTIVELVGLISLRNNRKYQIRGNSFVMNLDSKLDNATEGRGGLCSIFVWTSDNFLLEYNCTCDVYASTVWTSISSASENAFVPFYSSGSSGGKQICSLKMLTKCLLPKIVERFCNLLKENEDKIKFKIINISRDKYEYKKIDVDQVINRKKNIKKTIKKHSQRRKIYKRSIKIKIEERHCKSFLNYVVEIVDTEIELVIYIDNSLVHHSAKKY